MHFYASICVNDPLKCRFLSDDFYSKGIECETNLGEDLLSRWLEVPHGIFIVANIHPALHYISLARTSFVFAQL